MRYAIRWDRPSNCSQLLAIASNRSQSLVVLTPIVVLAAIVFTLEATLARAVFVAVRSACFALAIVERLSLRSRRTEVSAGRREATATAPTAEAAATTA